MKKKDKHNNDKQNDKISLKNFKWEKDNVIYETLSNRRISRDNILWQAPSLFFLAQSILLTPVLAFPQNVTRAIDILFLIISVLITIMTLIIMYKNRELEISDSKTLSKIEKSVEKPNIHQRPPERLISAFTITFVCVVLIEAAILVIMLLLMITNHGVSHTAATTVPLKTPLMKGSA